MVSVIFASSFVYDFLNVVGQKLLPFGDKPHLQVRLKSIVMGLVA
jgi:hypothetical protein